MSRKLDAAIAEALEREVIWMRKVSVSEKRGRITYRYYPCKPDAPCSQPCLAGTDNVVVPKYSTDGNDMLRLDTEMQKRGWLLDTWSETGVYALFKRREDVDDADVTGWVAQGHADTMPLAVALAAYHALTGKEWTG